MNRLSKLFLAIAFTTMVVSCNEAKKDKDNNTKTTDKKVEEEPKIKIDELATARAQIMGGIEVSYKNGLDSILNTPQVKQHYAEFNKSWVGLESSRLSKMRHWRDSELKDFNEGGKTLFYPFSGPDILNAYEFFPNCENYLMFGLEKDGNLPDLKKLPPRYLSDIRFALRDVFTRNYFITSHMGGLWGQGVLPFLNIFLVRTGNEIVSNQRFYLEKDGKIVTLPLEDEKTIKGKVSGVVVEFFNKNRKKTQKVYYISGDVSDKALKQKDEIVKFISNFQNKVTFIKSASYILHNADFATFRNLILNETSAVLQDDTGIRYKEYADRGWSIDLYGKYAPPVADFGRYTYQPDVAAIFNKEKDKIKPLGFTYGYHWKNDNSSVFVARKGSGGNKAVAVEEKKDKKTEKGSKK
jgi:hypothetical protein